MKITDKITITNEDNMALMARYPDNYFDLAITDPPYFSGPEKRKYYGRKISAARHSKTGVISNVNRVEYDGDADWSDKIPTEKYLLELLRVSKNQIIWGVNYYDFINLLGPGRIVWDKVNDTSQFSDCEIAFCSIHDSVRIFRYMWNGMMQGKSISEGTTSQGNKQLNEKRIHPTQKPVILYKAMLNKYAELGFKVIDTHTGSASLAVACHDLDFEFVGCDINKTAYTDSVDRLMNYVAQQRLF